MIIGLLMDVSESMMKPLQISEVNPGHKNVSRAHSIFRTLINVINSDRRFDEQIIFGLAFGLRSDYFCDLIELLDYVRETKSRRERFGSVRLYIEHLLSSNYVGITYNRGQYIIQSSGYLSDEFCIYSYESLIRMLEINGAPLAGDYVRQHLDVKEASSIFEMLAERPELIRDIVRILPEECKNPAVKAATSRKSMLLNVVAFVPNLFISADKQIKTGTRLTKETVDKCKNEAKQLIHKAIDEEIKSHCNKPKTWRLDKIVSILMALFPRSSGATNDERKVTEPTTKQVNNILATIEPFIYGGTPMFAALESASALFHSVSADDKALFILSDGEASDGNPNVMALRLKDNGVTLFCCFLTGDHIARPKQLYDRSLRNWSDGCRTMFNMSSEVPNSSKAMCILLRHGWQLPSSGRSKLFVQANHPDVIDDFSGVVNRMISSNDALLDMIGYVSLDLYINQSNSGFQTQRQIGGTCYANAVAAVFHLAMSRIVGRDGGVPDFFDVREDLIAAYGSDGANTKKVLADTCPKYRLHFKKVDATGARQALNHKRPVVARFRLTDKCSDACQLTHVHVRQAQWQRFSEFFEKTPSGILSRVDVGEPGADEKRGGHAVILMRCDAGSLTFMNSWGTEWADGGFFSISNESVLNDMKFYDVYWDVDDLTECEKQAYEKHSLEEGTALAKEIPLNVHTLKYECPKCKQASGIYEYSGHLSKAVCPKCKETFEPTLRELMISLYMYSR